MAGSSEGDEWVVRGNHHDAWVNGAEDPVSGQMSLAGGGTRAGRAAQAGMASEADHHLRRVGWRRADAARLDGVGEQHAPSCSRHAVAYINTDGNGRGFLQAEGAHSLEALVNGVARDVHDPEADMSVWKRLQVARIHDAENAEARAQFATALDLQAESVGIGHRLTPSSSITWESRR